MGISESSQPRSASASHGRVKCSRGNARWSTRERSHDCAMARRQDPAKSGRVIGHRLADLGRVISPTPLVRGRDAELASLGVQLHRVRSGTGAVVLIEGETGMGKTRLLAEAARVARRLGFRVGGGAGEPGAGIVELGALMTALFDGTDPLLDRSGLRELHSAPEQRYWL